MNKGELVDAVAKSAGENKNTVDRVLTATMEVIMATVTSGQKVTLVGFGSFEPRVRKERDGRNPKTKESMKIPETVVPAFSAGKSFKEQVADNIEEIKETLKADKKKS
ncbi:MAG: DNA-binding protein [Cyanobacteria bacterium M5B4]|nr:MAG: DNA-binding protein [Cyanobacteria bacterium M5B4]